MNELTNTRNDLFQREQMLIRLYRNEVDARQQQWQFAQKLQTNDRRIAFRKQNRINILSQEKTVFQILVRRHKTEADLAEFNRALIFNRYQKWKVRELNS